MLFQKKGGLQIQVKETLAALLEAGMDADIFDPLSAKLEDYDVIHVFSANHGNYNIVAAAKEAGCKVVMSPLAEDKWNRKIAFRSRLIDKVLRRLSSYLNYSFYSQVAHCFKQCDHSSGDVFSISYAELPFATRATAFGVCWQQKFPISKRVVVGD